MAMAMVANQKCKRCKKQAAVCYDKHPTITIDGRRASVAWTCKHCGKEQTSVGGAFGVSDEVPDDAVVGVVVNPAPGR